MVKPDIAPPKVDQVQSEVTPDQPLAPPVEPPPIEAPPVDASMTPEVAAKTLGAGNQGYAHPASGTVSNVNHEGIVVASTNPEHRGRHIHEIGGYYPRVNVGGKQQIQRETEAPQIDTTPPPQEPGAWSQAVEGFKQAYQDAKTPPAPVTGREWKQEPAPSVPEDAAPADASEGAGEASEAAEEQADAIAPEVQGDFGDDGLYYPRFEGTYAEQVDAIEAINEALNHAAQTGNRRRANELVTELTQREIALDNIGKHSSQWKPSQRPREGVTPFDPARWREQTEQVREDHRKAMDDYEASLRDEMGFTIDTGLHALGATTATPEQLQELGHHLGLPMYLYTQIQTASQLADMIGEASASDAYLGEDYDEYGERIKPPMQKLADAVSEITGEPISSHPVHSYTNPIAPPRKPSYESITEYSSFGEAVDRYISPATTKTAFNLGGLAGIAGESLGRKMASGPRSGNPGKRAATAGFEAGTKWRDHILRGGQKRSSTAAGTREPKTDPDAAKVKAPSTKAPKVDPEAAKVEAPKKTTAATGMLPKPSTAPTAPPQQVRQRPGWDNPLTAPEEDETFADAVAAQQEAVEPESPSDEDIDVEALLERARRVTDEVAGRTAPPTPAPTPTPAAAPEEAPAEPVLDMDRLDPMVDELPRQVPTGGELKRPGDTLSPEDEFALDHRGAWLPNPRGAPADPDRPEVPVKVIRSFPMTDRPGAYTREPRGTSNVPIPKEMRQPLEGSWRRRRPPVPSTEKRPGLLYFNPTERNSIVESSPVPDQEDLPTFEERLKAFWDSQFTRYSADEAPEVVGARTFTDEEKRELDELAEELERIEGAGEDDDIEFESDFDDDDEDDWDDDDFEDDDDDEWWEEDDEDDDDMDDDEDESFADAVAKYDATAGEWKTIKGTHVLIDDEGKIAAGPKRLRDRDKSPEALKEPSAKQYRHNPAATSGRKHARRGTKRDDIAAHAKSDWDVADERTKKRYADADEYAQAMLDSFDQESQYREDVRMGKRERKSRTKYEPKRGYGEQKIRHSKKFKDGLKDLGVEPTKDNLDHYREVADRLLEPINQPTYEILDALRNTFGSAQKISGALRSARVGQDEEFIKGLDEVAQGIEMDESRAGILPSEPGALFQFLKDMDGVSPKPKKNYDPEVLAAAHEEIEASGYDEPEDFDEDDEDISFDFGIDDLDEFAAVSFADAVRRQLDPAASN